MMLNSSQIWFDVFHELHKFTHIKSQNNNPIIPQLLYPLYNPTFLRETNALLLGRSRQSGTGGRAFAELRRGEARFVEKSSVKCQGWWKFRILIKEIICIYILLRLIALIASLMSKPIGVEGIRITDMSFQWAEFSQAALAAGQAAAEATATPKASLGTCWMGGLPGNGSSKKKVIRTLHGDPDYSLVSSFQMVGQSLWAAVRHRMDFIDESNMIRLVTHKPSVHHPECGKYHK